MAGTVGRRYRSLPGTYLFIQLYIARLGSVSATMPNCIRYLLYRVPGTVPLTTYFLPSYPTTSRAWRLKGVLLYSLSTSLLLCLGLILRQVVALCLHWNPEVCTGTVPYLPTYVGSYRYLPTYVGSYPYGTGLLPLFCLFWIKSCKKKSFYFYYIFVAI